MFRFSSIVFSSMLFVSAMGQDTILDIASGAPDFKTLASAVGAAPKVADALSGPGPLTVFAPLDSAFAALDQQLLSNLLTPPYVAHLTDLLFLHATSGNITSGDISNGDLLMANNETLTVAVQGDTITLEASNSSATVNDTAFDIIASNGVIHSINSVLLPKWVDINLFELIDELEGKGYDTVIRLIKNLGDITSSLGPQKVTVFAPSDAAFEEAPQEVKDILAGNDTVAITAVLTNHVALALLPTENMASGQTMDSFSGIKWPITVEGGKYMIEGATIVDPDVLANNGIVQGIDKVLYRVPGAPTIPPAPPAPTPGGSPSPPTPGGSPSSPTPGAPTASGVASLFYGFAAAIVGASTILLA